MQVAEQLEQQEAALQGPAGGRLCCRWPRRRAPRRRRLHGSMVWRTRHYTTLASQQSMGSLHSPPYQRSAAVAAEHTSLLHQQHVLS